jgi:hypothetical protein
LTPSRTGRGGGMDTSLVFQTGAESITLATYQ